MHWKVGMVQFNGPHGESRVQLMYKGSISQQEGACVRLCLRVDSEGRGGHGYLALRVSVPLPVRINTLRMECSKDGSTVETPAAGAMTSLIMTSREPVDICVPSDEAVFK